MRPNPILPILCILLPLTACSETTAAGRVTLAGTATIAAIQVNQYSRDAQVTEIARAGTAAALEYQAASTSAAAQQTAIAVAQAATAQAIAAGYTQQAVATQAMRAATQQAVHDLDSTATVQALNRANVVSTQAAAVVATGTAEVVAAETKIRLDSAAADAEQKHIANGMLIAFTLVGASLVMVGLLVWWRVVVANERKRGMVQRYGAANSQAVMVIDDGAGGYAILDPKTGFALGAQVRGGKLVTAPLTPEAMQLLENAQKVQAIEAEHSPHAPARPEPAKLEKRAWHIGAIGAASEQAVYPRGESVSVEPLTRPEVPPAAAQLTAPERETFFVKDPRNTLANRDASDKWEFIVKSWPAREGGGGKGLARSAWIGRKFDGTGNKVTPKYWGELVDKLVMCQVAEADGRGEARPIMPLPEALDAFGLAHYDPQDADPTTTRTDARTYPSTSG